MSQMVWFKEKYAAVISAKICNRQVLDAMELWGFIARHIYHFNKSDIFQAIIGRMYCNPEENLWTHSGTNFVIYDEFHAYRELS